MTIFIASDHGGFELKNKIINEIGLEIVDLGPYELDPEDDYPDFAFKLAEKIASTHNSIGILICRSGNGMIIAANKVQGAYAALCFTTKHAEKAREDDNSNILGLDADYEGEDPIKIAKTYITTKFAGSGTRHERRFEKIREYEFQREDEVTDNTKPQATLDSAIFYTNKFTQVVEFYKDFIGFEVDKIVEGKFVSFWIDKKTRLGIKKATEEREKPGSQTILISNNKIDLAFQFFKTSNAKFYKELTVEPWGIKFSILDPDGNKLEFLQRT